MATEGYIALTLRITQEEGVFVAVCEELGVSTSDDRLDHVIKEMQVLVGQHLNSLEKNGVRAKFFKKHGIQIHKGEPSAVRKRVPVRFGEMVTRLTERIPVMAGA